MYAAVVARRTDLQQPSGPHKSQAKGSDHTEPAASSEVATRRMCLGDMSGPLCGMPYGTTLSTQVATNSAAPTGEQQNKTPNYVSRVMDMQSFLSWIWALCQSGLSAQMKGRS